MGTKKQDQRLAILRVLHDTDGLLGSGAIAEAISVWGFEMSPRTIRLHLHEMEQEGLVIHAKQGRNGGRRITDRGVEELRNSRVTERVGFTAARVDALSWKMRFDLESSSGTIVLNVTTIDERNVSRALEEMAPVFRARLGMGRHLTVSASGESLGDFKVPEGKVAIGTVCSVTLNGVLLRKGIPTVSRFGGVLEVANGRPVRFTDVIYYDGTTLDPLEVFIKGGLTSVREAARTGHGRIGASFREVPTEAIHEVEEITRELDRIGLNGVFLIGRPNQPLLDFPVHHGRTGMVVTGGLNPVAAIEESGIETTSVALASLLEFGDLVYYENLIPPRIASPPLG